MGLIGLGAAAVPFAGPFAGAAIETTSGTAGSLGAERAAEELYSRLFGGSTALEDALQQKALQDQRLEYLEYALHHKVLRDQLVKVAEGMAVEQYTGYTLTTISGISCENCFVIR